MNKTKPISHAQHPLTLIFESRPLRESLDEDIVQKALCAPVVILDAGNCFNPLRLTRSIRRQTVQIQQTLDRIQVARAFTCFQVVSLLEQTRYPKGSVFILRLLTTFADEMAPVYERQRLLDQVDTHIERLRCTVPVTVVIKKNHFQDDPLLEWVAQLQGRADEIVFPKLGFHSEPATLFR